MYREAKSSMSDADIFIGCAAVADFKPKNLKKNKIKKSEKTSSVELEKTVDILQQLGEKKSNQFLVGFSVETENGLANAKTKLQKKNLDAIVLNSLEDKGAGFQHNTNKITFIPAKGKHKTYPLKNKSEVAVDILDEIKTMIDA